MARLGANGDEYSEQKGAQEATSNAMSALLHFLSSFMFWEV